MRRSGRAGTLCLLAVLTVSARGARGDEAQDRRRVEAWARDLAQRDDGSIRTHHRLVVDGVPAGVGVGIAEGDDGYLEDPFLPVRFGLGLRYEARLHRVLGVGVGLQWEQSWRKPYGKGWSRYADVLRLPVSLVASAPVAGGRHEVGVRLGLGPAAAFVDDHAFLGVGLGLEVMLHWIYWAGPATGLLVEVGGGLDWARGVRVRGLPPGEARNPGILFLAAALRLGVVLGFPGHSDPAPSPTPDAPGASAAPGIVPPIRGMLAAGPVEVPRWKRVGR
jgi:hypothetical protein